MSADTQTICPQTEPAPFRLVLIGGLTMHGEMTAEAAAGHAEHMAIEPEKAACEILALIGEGLISVHRDEQGGKLIATPSMAQLCRTIRVRGVTTYLAQAKAVSHA